MSSFGLGSLPGPARHLWGVLARASTTWLVGGAVRDLKAGVKPSDVDLATALLPHEVRRLVEEKGFRTTPVGEKFGRIGIMTATGRVDVTTFREEGGYRDGRHPSQVRFTRDGLRDLLRRDFTINAMALTPEGRLLDPAAGLKDLDAGIIRAVGDPHRRLHEDHLRGLRAIRFLAYDPGHFVLESTLADAIATLGMSEPDVTPARRGMEWAAILHHPWPDRALEAGARLGLWTPFFFSGRRLGALADPAARLLALRLTGDVSRLGHVEWPRALKARERLLARVLEGKDPPRGELGTSARALAAWLGRPDPLGRLRGTDVMRLFHMRPGPWVGRVLEEERRILQCTGSGLSEEALFARLQRFVQNLKESSD